MKSWRNIAALTGLFANALSCTPSRSSSAVSRIAPASESATAREPAPRKWAAPPSESDPASVAGIAAPYPWIPDRGNGSYQNPVLYADYSDPDVVRSGSEYYLVASSFQCTPGLPILRSTDLVNWTLVGHALENLPDPRYAAVRHGEGIWAPSLREHRGKFYLFAPTPDEGIYVLTAPHPAGPWSKPRLLLAGKGLIDPCPLWDDDGKAYLVHAYARSRAGIRDRLRVRPMAPDASRVLGEGQIVFMDPERQPTIEGPKFLKKDGYYYLLAPAGGVPTGWQVVLRSRSVYGPYEDKNVLHQGSTPINGPHQGALVDTPGGQWWFVHFQDAGVYGRVVHLNPVKWRDGWPLMGITPPGGTIGEPVLSHPKPALPASPIATPATSDEFDAKTLGLQWQWHANHDAGWASLARRPGFLRLFPERAGAEPDFSRVSRLLLQKLPARAFVVETALEPGGEAGLAGLIVMGQSHAALAVGPARNRLAVRSPSDELAVTLIVDRRAVEGAEIPAGPVVLRAEMADGGLCRFGFRAGGSERSFDTVFQAKAGRWIGAKVGLFALALDEGAARSHADFDYFRFGKPGSRALQQR